MPPTSVCADSTLQRRISPSFPEWLEFFQDVLARASLHICSRVSDAKLQRQVESAHTLVGGTCISDHLMRLSNWSTSMANYSANMHWTDFCQDSLSVFFKEYEYIKIYLPYRDTLYNTYTTNQNDIDTFKFFIFKK